MSANPTRVDWGSPALAADPAFPLQEGNRVLESLARQEALKSLLAFSELHERIRARRAGESSSGDWDLFQTERFVLNEVLQLICDRVTSITHADGVLIALQDGAEIVCRASAGAMAIEREVRLSRESEFVADCLDAGRILRCDDCDVDSRVELDLSRQIGARSSVIVPLRGNKAQIGVLQAFSNVPFAFSDDDVRCLDLLGELVLSAIRPEDQDRRMTWLTDVAEEVLGARPAETPDKPLIEQPVAATENSTEVLGAAEVASLSEAPPDFQRVQPLEAPAEAALPQSSEPVAEDIPAPAFLAREPGRRRPHPGLSVVFVLVGVAALFSAGVWFGMREHDRQRADESPIAILPPTSVSAPISSDHLMDPSKLEPGVSPSKLSVLPKVTNIRHWSTPMGSTVVIDMQDQAPYEVHRLMSPERIYFDIHDTALAAEFEGRTIDVGDAALSRVRIAQPIPGVTRVVLDTRDGSNFSVSMESSPYRLVVELRGSDRALAANRTAPADNRTAAALSPLPANPEESRTVPKAGRFRIALDAGHGGWDLGTVGRNGLQEKDLVLDVTRRLGKLLQTRLGSEVIFTRTGDVYLPLDERADFANQAQADLFVSVHANYSSTATARGVETYYTNTFTAPGSRDVENPETAISHAPTPVSMSTGELHDKIEESRRLATNIQRSLHSTLSATNPGIRDRGVKDSQFVVLTGTTMPSILTEISFVSSPADERNLQSENYREQIAEALYRGIAKYAATASRHVKMAEVQGSATPR